MSGTIVVGVDGSHPAQLAARWAAREAELRDAGLVLISAWNVPAEGFAFAGPAFTDDVLKSLEMSAEQRLGDAVDEVRLASNAVDVTTKAIEGQATSVLLNEARTADLLVVGSRGLGGFRGLLLGSVSQQCVDHAACPVVVVRHLHAEV